MLAQIGSLDQREGRMSASTEINRGFTLMELMVTIAAIALLLGFLLPAVSAARESARRMQCSNHLRQMGIGLHSYEVSFKKFPPGYTSDRAGGVDGGGWGWGAVLLDFIDQEPLSKRLSVVTRSLYDVGSDPDTAPLLTLTLPLYLCPSDAGGDLPHPHRSIPVSSWMAVSSSKKSRVLLAHVFPPPPPRPGGDLPTKGFAKSNYVGSLGNGWKAARSEWRDSDFEGNGMFGRNTRIRISLVLDGLSNTIAMGERSMRNYAAVWPGVEFQDGCGFRGNQMLLGTAFYPINDAAKDINYDCDGQGSANYSSYHAGGANFMFADGSVHFLSQAIDRSTFGTLAQRNDGHSTNGF